MGVSLLDEKKPYDQGGNAYLAGNARSTNPHASGTKAYQDWLSGYDEQQISDEEALGTDRYGGFMGPYYQGGPEDTYYSGSGNGLSSRCGGSGMLDCHCGGDNCVCGWRGEAECYGCPDCEGLTGGYYD